MVNWFLKTEILFIWNHSIGSQIMLRMHLRVSRTLWPLGAFSGPYNPGHNATGPQADGLAHPKRVKKGKLFSQNRNTFHLGSLIWVSDKADNASQSIYNPLASELLLMWSISWIFWYISLSQMVHLYSHIVYHVPLPDASLAFVYF